MKLHWYLPTHGDGRTLLTAGSSDHTRPPEDAVGDAGGRVATLDYLTQVALAAEYAGFDAALTPTGTWCEDAWLTTAALGQRARRLRFIVAFRPGAIAPTLAAQQAATLQRLLAGRLLLNVVTGGDPIEQRRFGDDLGKAERYERSDEFLTILRGAWGGEPFDFRGRHLWVDQAVASHLPEPPEIYFGGSSEAALEVAARHADVSLMFGVAPPVAAEQVARVTELAAARKRARPRFGIRLHVVTRDTSAEAWSAAEALLADARSTDIKAAQALLVGSESTGQQRMRALHGGSREDLEIYPGLWAGVGLLRMGAGTAMVGSHEEVAELIQDYVHAGVEEFLLSGYPCVEEALQFGDGVRPLLRDSNR